MSYPQFREEWFASLPHDVGRELKCVTGLDLEMELESMCKSDYEKYVTHTDFLGRVIESDSDVANDYVNSRGM